ncbi:MAG: hypothetical protein EBT79_02540 [Actinobacteria bacterium]|nr:hypothetical protein [Actinomycetota bacterium]NBR66154.1 hypothetical protein [Actinomycetota bacterium]
MNVHRVSWFNVDRICEGCQSEEEAHPDFQNAREVEHAAVVAGDLNFPGVGWPGRDGRVMRGA